jgi:hypothetical protein
MAVTTSPQSADDARRLAARNPRWQEASVTKGVGALSLLLALSVAEVANAEENDPFLLFDDNGTTIRATLQFGANLVSEANLFWNLSEGAAPGSGFDPDATWLELYVKPGLTFETALDGGASVYGRISAVGSYTSGTDAFDTGDTGRWTLEESVVGLRSPIGPDAEIDLSFGAQGLRLGTGMLISDGASDGFERGALKFGPRRAWEMTGIAELTSGDFTGTVFYLDPRERPEVDGENALAGLDLRHDDPRGGYLGFTYVNVLNSTSAYPQADRSATPPVTVIPGAREGTETVNLYARTNPFAGALENFFFTGDLAYQWNERIDLEAWAGRVQAGYTFADTPWAPILTYSYQTFSGDDPDTSTLERFDPLYYDGSPSAWATGSKSAMIWINSNVQSHNLALSLRPTPRDTITLRYAHVRANQLNSPLQFGQATRVDLVGSGSANVISGVTDAHLSDDFFIEYQRVISRNVFVSAGASVAIPGKGIDDVFPDDTPNWVGGFVNVVFNF